jgi:hypothetical protein
MTGRNALKGTLGGDGGIFRRKSAVYEMAKEPRVSRRALSEMMTASMGNFPDKAKGIVRQLTYLPSFFPDRCYVFLQLFHDNPGDYGYGVQAASAENARVCLWCGETQVSSPEEGDGYRHRRSKIHQEELRRLHLAGVRELEQRGADLLRGS